MRQFSTIQAKAYIAIFALAMAALATPSAGFGQAAAPAVRNQAWATRMTTLLNLSPVQQAALKAFTEVTARSAEVSGPSAAQIRAMSLVEQFDHWSMQVVQIQAHAQADGAALHRFYATLTPQQRAQFDAATRRKDPGPNMAADVVPSTGIEEPDFRLPAHTEPDWLVKPTAENIARVYPSAAAEARITGRAVLHCMVDEDGYLADCAVTGEQPQGQGFGNAALEMTAYMRIQPALNYGVPSKGQVTVPIAFTLPDPD